MRYDVPTYANATSAWRALLSYVLEDGQVVAPRTKHLNSSITANALDPMTTKEILHASVAFNMDDPVVRVQQRKLSLRFAAAEALWILSGSDELDEIAPYNKAMEKFSDDGRTLWGAYGPRVVGQLPHVIDVLRKDRSTRQAVLTCWRPRYNFVATTSKDVPCTVALTFNVRDEKLNCHAFMRSSDLWLGWPYDMFTFTAIACKVASCLNPTPNLGRLHYTAVSCHLYRQHWDIARDCADNRTALVERGRAIPHLCVEHHAYLRYSLERCRDGGGLLEPVWNIRKVEW